MPSREEEWQRIYDALSVFLQQFGKNEIYPPGDLWLVEDDWGEAQQKICILNADVLTPRFVYRLQGFLRHVAPDWTVIVAMDIADKPMPGDGMGLAVSASSVKYHWDLTLLRNILGNPHFFET